MGKLAQIINDMKIAGLNILGIAEMRWPTSGQLVSDDVTVLYSGGSKLERGVGLLLSKEATRSIVSWEPISERIIAMRLRTRHTCETIAQVHTSTETAPESDKDLFYNELSAVLDDIPSYDLRILMGYLNAQIGSDTTGVERIIGKEAVGDLRSTMPMSPTDVDTHRADKRRPNKVSGRRHKLAESLTNAI